MTTLNVDFNDVPDEYPQIAPGIYDFSIDGAPELKGSKKDASKMVLHVKLKVDTEGEFNGMTILTWICTWTDMGRVDLKKFLLGAGIDLSQPVDLNEIALELDGQIVTAVVKSEIQVDPLTGEQMERRSIKEFVVS